MPKQRPIQEEIKGKKHKPKSPRILHATRDKHHQNVQHNQTRNGNGSGSSRVFSYPDPTRGPRPSARILNEFFSRGPDPPCGPQPKITNLKICTNLESQIAEYNVIFLAIIQFSCYPNGCQDLTNQSVQKIQQIPETKLANLKIPATKHQENPTNLAHKKKKKKPQTQILLTKIRKEKIPNHIDCGFVTGEGWFTVDL